MRTPTLAEQLDAVGRRLARDVSPFSVIDRAEDHCPAADLFLPGPDAIRVQELNEAVERDAKNFYEGSA
jgi:hypothetical protein